MPSVACQTEFAVDEATRLNETAIHIYLDILNILDDEPTPVIYDLGERAASQVLAAPVSICVGSEDHPALSPSSPKASQALPGDLLNESRETTSSANNNVDEKSLDDLEEEEFRFESEMRARLAGIRKGLRDPVETWLEDQAFGVWRSRNPSSGTAFSDDFKPNVSRLFFTNCMYETAFVPGATLCVEIEEEGEEDREETTEDGDDRIRNREKEKQKEDAERKKKWNEHIVDEKQILSDKEESEKDLEKSECFTLNKNEIEKQIEEEVEGDDKEEIIGGKENTNTRCCEAIDSVDDNTSNSAERWYF